MKRCLSLAVPTLVKFALVALTLAIFASLSTTAAWAAPSQATLTRVKRTHQPGTRHRAHKAGKHHTPKRNRHHTA